MNRSEAAKKGWATRRYRAFEDGQLPLPFRGGVHKGARAKATTEGEKEGEPWQKPASPKR
jgi:hypothetical protein